MQSITNLAEAELALEPFWPRNIARYAYTLEHIERFMDYVGNPQDKPKSIHIAGTSGKTSTAYYTASLLQQTGKKVGLLTSPHIMGLNERIQINLEPLPEAEFCSELTIFMGLIEKSGILLTFAEILYGFAYWVFARRQVDYIVIEVGMGGLLDATNVITRQDKIAVITDIGLDHVHTLGNTLSEITQHKAGIIKLHNAVFCHAQTQEVMAVIRATCKQRQADLNVVEQDERTPKSLPLFQQRNFSLALEVASRALERDGESPLDEKQILEAAKVHIPARMEVIEVAGKKVILDNAHNQQKFHVLMQSLASEFGDQPIAAMVAFVQTDGRNLEDMLDEIQPFVSHLIATELEDKKHTSRPCEEVLQAYHGPSSEAIADCRQAVDALLKRPEPILLITGSTYLFQGVRPYLK